MSQSHSLRWIGHIVMMLTLAASHVSAADGDELGAAQELYEQARYEDALNALGTLPAEGDANSQQDSIAKYRALCLIALGRSSEAEEVVEAAVLRTPDYRPDFGDSSPRLLDLVKKVRGRTLPSLVRARYQSARASFDRDAKDEALKQFREVMSLLEAPELGSPEINDETRASLEDIRVLASGFVTLLDSKPPLAASAPVPAEPMASTPPAVAPSPPSEAAITKSIYGVEDVDVVPPVAVRQEVPGWRPSFGPFIPGRRALLSVVIDESGRIEEASLAEPIQVGYDQLLMLAAKSWRYRPAEKDGTPVRYRRIIEVTFVASKD